MNGIYNIGGYYETYGTELAFTPENAYEFILKEEIELYKKGDKHVSLPEDEFKGLSYENIISWAASIDAEELMDRVDKRQMVALAGKTYTYRNPGESMAFGWVSECKSHFTDLKFNEEDAERFISYIADELDEIMVLFTDLGMELPNPVWILENLKECKDSCYTDSDDYLDFYDMDAFHTALYKVIGKFIVDNGLKTFTAGGHTWTWGYVPELMSKE